MIYKRVTTKLPFIAESETLKDTPIKMTSSQVVKIVSTIREFWTINYSVTHIMCNNQDAF